MKKKINLLMIIVSILMLTSACSVEKKTEKNIPKKIITENTVAQESVTEFMESAKKFEIEKMISKVDPNNRDDMGKISKIYEESQKGENIYLLDYFKENAQMITYDITDTTIEGNNAIVSMDISYVDGTPLFKAVTKDYMKQVLSSKISGKSLNKEETIKMVISSMKKQEEKIEEPIIQKTTDVKCVKIDGEWFIEEINEDLYNMLTSNVISYIEKIDKDFNLGYFKPNQK